MPAPDRPDQVNPTTTATERVLKAGWVCLASQPRPPGGGDGTGAGAGAPAADDDTATTHPRRTSSASSASSGGSGAGGPTQWRRKWAYLLPDRLCFGAPPTPDTHTPPPHRPRVRYLPLDRLSARARAGPAGAPGLGLATIRPGLLTLPPGCAGALALSAGGRTHYLATQTAREADDWVDSIGAAWEACINDGGPRSLFVMSAAAPTSTPPPPLEASVSAASACASAWATAAAEPPSAPAATPRDDGYSTPPVRAWSAGSRAAPDAASPTLTTTTDPVTRYTVTLVTASAPAEAGAPPGAEVSIELLGARRAGPRVRLPAAPGDFGRGRAATFGVELPWAGLLTGLTVRLSAAGSGWRLDRVEVEDEAGGESVAFPCGRWVSGGGSLTLAPGPRRPHQPCAPPPPPPPPSGYATPAPSAPSPVPPPPGLSSAWETQPYRAASSTTLRPAGGSGGGFPFPASYPSASSPPPPSLPPLRVRRSSFAAPPPPPPLSRGSSFGLAPPPPAAPAARWPSLSVPTSPGGGSGSFSASQHPPPPFPATPLARAATLAAEARLDDSERALSRLADERAAAAEGDAARDRAALSGVFGSLRGDVTRATAQLADAEAALAATREERARLEAALAEASARAAEAARAAAAREASLWADGRAASEEAAAAVAAARAAAEDAAARAGAADAARAALEATLRVARSDAASAEAALDSARARSEEATRRAAESAARADVAAEDAADARDRAAGADAAVGAARSDAARARGDAEAARSSNAAALADAAAARDRAAAADAAAAAARAGADAAARALAGVGDERARLGAVLAGLRTGLAAASARVCAFQADLEGGPPPSPPGWTAHRLVQAPAPQPPPAQTPPPDTRRVRVEVATDGVECAVGDVLVTLFGGGGGPDAATPSAGPYRLLTDSGARLSVGGTATFILEEVPALVGRGTGPGPGAPAGVVALEVVASAAAPPAPHHTAPPPGAWRLAWVRVTDLECGDTAMFQASGEWLRAGGPGCVLKAGGPPTPPPAAPRTPPQATSTPAPAPVPSLTSAPGYRIAFYTSPFCTAGTRAQVRFELVGDGGGSGDVLLPQSARAGHFRPGGADVFTYPLLPSVGRLRALRVGTDGGGLFPAWHLGAVEVVHLPTGSVTRFACHAFVDKRCGWARVLHGETLTAGGTPPLRATLGGPGSAGTAAPPAPALFAPPPFEMVGGWGGSGAAATAAAASGLVPASPSAAAWKAAVAAATAAAVAGRVPGPLGSGAPAGVWA